jgi:hypothetical protein
MTEAELLNMLRSRRNQESSLFERKPDGFKDREARKTVVAFANSTPEGQEAVLFIGVHDKTGEVLGVANAEELQRKYAKVLAECYPSITYQMHALTVSDKTAVAIVVPSSTRRPHFAGGAYVRKGSQSVLSSDEMYDELILSRNDSTRELLKYKHASTILSVRGINYHLGSNNPFSGGGHVEGCECQVRSCDGFRVTLYNIASQVSFTENLERVSISFDDKSNRPMLLVTAPGR